MKFLRFLFPAMVYSTSYSCFLLAMRLLFGGLLMSHGIAKLTHFSAMAASFPDPLGVGSRVSLVLAIFGELVCSIGFVFGAFYRLALIPMIFTMCMAFFVIHHGDAFATKELAFVYMIVFVLMFVVGPGEYALDRLVVVRLRK